MPDGYSEPVFLDATVISNFASTDSIDFLVSVLESAVVVPAVRDEIEQGRQFGHEYLDSAAEAFGKGLRVSEISPETEDEQFRERLDAGEAEALASALEQGGTLATDDLAARRLADERDVPVTGSIGILVLGIERGHIDSETADEWLDTWRETRGYYAPVESVEEVLDE